jgi:hypothetical protein
MSNSAIETIRAMFKMMHEQWLDATFEGANHEQAHWEPSGKSVPIAAHYAHVVTAEDAMFAMALGKKPAPLMASVPTGLSELPPQGAWDDWGRRLKMDKPKFQAYAKQVYAQTDAVLTGMKEADLQQMVDTPAGQMPALAFATVLLMNGAAHTGEMSAIKGMQGLKGYPF